MTTYDCVILTDQRYLNDSSTDAYKHNVYHEDRLVYHALEELGLKTLRLAWDDMFFDWSTTKSVLFRTTWDYFDRFDEFSVWLENVSNKTTLINSEALIRWNIDKHYLLDLQKKGVHIAESHFIEQGAQVSLEQLHDILDWKETVLKPCVSGAGRHTYKLNLDNLSQHESIFQELIAKEAMMLQPFQYNIVTKGELSLMLFNGQYTHAVLKKAKSGDFRVQDDFGGTVHDYTPTDQEIKFAESSVRACKELPLYARVDIFEDNDGEIALSELELIEPELWFRRDSEAANVLASAIRDKLKNIQHA